jgi:predicted nucleic acid-binding protein
MTRADNRVLATAESAAVSYLVTGAAELQRIRQYGAVAILSPRQFLAVLDLTSLETS